MDPTALVTFLFRAPPEVRTVELLGSWDNFTLPYRMHHDRRRGNGFWSGCFKFENVIFDGDELQWTKPRNGGLKQGGTYWYYYKLNYDLDAYDDKQPTTTSCPLLPGQAVNVIEVPIELVEPPTRCRSAYGDIIGSLANSEEQTLDPANKFAMLEPPPVSKVHNRCVSDDALDGRLENQQPLIVIEDTVSPVSTSHHDEGRTSSVDSKLQQDEMSRASSIYSQRSSHSPPASALTASNAEVQASEHSHYVGDAALPSFPYPGVLGAAPLDSVEQFGATLFKSSSAADAPEPPGLDFTETRLKRASVTSCGPASVQNVQFYGSRPGTSLNEDEEQHRPRMYSLPNLEIRDYLDDTDPCVPTSPTSFYSPRRSEDEDENPTPGEIGGFDPISPTFSAATISTGGQNTPFRLSAQNSVNENTHARSDNEGDMGTITERLRSLGASQDEVEGLTSTSEAEHSYSATRLSPPSFINYSLPMHATESSHSLVKTSSNRSALPRSRRELALPLPSILHEGEGRSMAEDIFSELGFA